jgi:hypothetical protein
VEITFDGQAVNIAGAPFPFRLAAKEKAVKWHILMDRDRLTILANDLFRVTKAVKVDQPANVTLMAEGGDALFKKVDLWELRPVRNGRSRGLHHFAPPSWTWGTGQLTGACLEESRKEVQDILKRYSSDGVTDYDAE